MMNLNWEKATREIINIDAGVEVIGIFGEREFIKAVDDQFKPGETRDLYVLNFTHPETKEVFGVWENGGLTGAMKLGKVQSGDLVKIIGKGKEAIKDVGMVNQYDIFKAKQ